MFKLKPLLILLLLSLNLFSQEHKYLTQAINLAGKQRMLGQMMAKNKVLIKSKIDKKNAEQEMLQAKSDFEYGLDYLKEHAPNQEIKHKIQIQEVTYYTYIEKIQSKSKSSLDYIINFNTLFLDICDEVVKSLVSFSKEVTTNQQKNNLLENISIATADSGKLRYLTQRLTLYYSLNRMDQTISTSEINTTVRDIENYLNHLTVLEFNTLAIDDSLSEVLFYWTKLKGKLLNHNNELNVNSESSISVEEMDELCLNLLQKMNKTTEMYVALKN